MTQEERDEQQVLRVDDRKCETCGAKATHRAVLADGRLVIMTSVAGKLCKECAERKVRGSFYHE